MMTTIATADGICEAFLARGAGADLPCVILLMDAIGLRPRIMAMAERLAAEGYLVVAPNLFYRTNALPLVDYDILLKPENHAELIRHVMGAAAQLSVEMSLRDFEAYRRFALSQPGARPGPVGIAGYCMGGGQALRAAGEYPDAVAAAAGFHAGNLATEADTSPHRWFPKIKAEVYLGHADQDRSMPPEQRDRVDAELKAAGTRAVTELYPGSKHGWTMADLPAFDPAGEARHWERLFALFERTLKNP